ncbi:MAG: DNA primase [Saprospiraceae bacterium]|nr:DNA primase [Saprospiraceae bacterium]
MITRATVDAIVDATRIEEVIEEFVSLRRRGSNLIGLCPFHHERSPSFNVNPARNIFKCFGCGKAGDAITFLMEHEHFSYPDALRWLAKKYNIEIEETQRTPEQVAEQQETDSLYIVNDFALRHFQEQLFESDEGKSVALAYFKKRGLREETIRNFGLGYAPDQRDLLLRRAVAAGHALDMLKKVGLCSTDGTRDFFRGRVMFAIHNLSGKVAAFAGRTMSADKTVPKYINSPETEIYVKNKTLYGAFQARRAMRRLDECILVEGYMDVIALHQAGIDNAVASSGTSLTEGQLQLIKRNAANLLILYDGDAAGISAALRGLDLALEQDLNVRMVLLPKGHDPDSYVQEHGGDALRAYIGEHARDFILFKTDLMLAETKHDPIRRASLVKDIVASIARIPDPIKRSVYVQQCAALVGVDEQVLVAETNKQIEQSMRQQQRRDERRGAGAGDQPEERPAPGEPVAEPAEKPLLRSDEFHERDVLRLLVLFGDQMLSDPPQSVAEYVLADVIDLLDSFDNAVYASLIREYKSRMDADGAAPDQSFFLQHPLNTIRSLAVDMMSTPWEMSNNWVERHNYPLQNQPVPERNFDRDTRNALDRFKFRKIEKLIAINLQRIKEAELQGDTEAMMTWLRVDQKIRQVRNELFNRLGGSVVPK